MPILTQHHHPASRGMLPKCPLELNLSRGSLSAPKCIPVSGPIPPDLSTCVWSPCQALVGTHMDELRENACCHHLRAELATVQSTDQIVMTSLRQGLCLQLRLGCIRAKRGYQWNVNNRRNNKSQKQAL